MPQAHEFALILLAMDIVERGDGSNYGYLQTLKAKLRRSATEAGRPEEYRATADALITGLTRLQAETRAED